MSDDGSKPTRDCPDGNDLDDVANTPEPGDFETLAEAALAQIDGTIDVPSLQAEVEVLRDEWGVPHIYAENRQDLFFAQGFVQAQDRLWQMDMWRRVHEGRLAEILGPEGLEHDRLARLIRFRGPWEEEWEVYHPDGKAIFQAFADGVNAYIDHIGDDLPVEYELTALEPLRWTPEASVGRLATALPLGQARAELELAQEVAEHGVEEVDERLREQHETWVDLEVPEGLDVNLVSDEAIEAVTYFDGGFPRPPLLPEYEEWEDAVNWLDVEAPGGEPGSNNWVVSGELTESGEVLLANDPHRGVTNPSLRYLVHLEAPDYSVIGATEPAFPGVAIGHNGDVGWGLTIAGTDQADVFVEELNPDDLDQARWEDEWYPLETVVDTIPVRGEELRVVEHKFSRHGPIFHVDSTNHLAYAFRSTSNEPGSAGYLGALRLAEVDNCQEFIDALAFYYAPSENMICGDADGNISWLAAALTPNREGGWHGRLPVPGTGEYRWDGFRPHAELPQEFNPERGWLGTANHDVQPEGYYPPIMFRSGPFSRWERLQEIFADAEDLTVEDYERMLHDTVHPWFDDDRPLFKGWSADDSEVEWARERVLEWDGTYDRDLAAPAIHNTWCEELDEEARNPDVVEERRLEFTREALSRTVESLRERLGHDRSEWRWGRINRSDFPHWLVEAYDLPSVERSGGGGTIAAQGATFRQIIDFEELDRSRVTNTPGQSMQPESPFYDDLLSLWADEEFFPLNYSREAVEAKATHELTLTPKP